MDERGTTAHLSHVSIYPYSPQLSFEIGGVVCTLQCIEKSLLYVPMATGVYNSRHHRGFLLSGAGSTSSA